MSHKLPDPPSGFDLMSIEEQVEYAEALCDRIAKRFDSEPIPEWHLELLEKRLANLHNATEGFKTLKDFQAAGFVTLEEFQAELSKH